jgi:hypothetical protein
MDGVCFTCRLNTLVPLLREDTSGSPPAFRGVLSMTVEECIDEGRELPVGDGIVITERTAIAVTR